MVKRWGISVPKYYYSANRIWLETSTKPWRRSHKTAYYPLPHFPVGAHNYSLSVQRNFDKSMLWPLGFLIPYNYLEQQSCQRTFRSISLDKCFFWLNPILLLSYDTFAVDLFWGFVRWDSRISRSCCTVFVVKSVFSPLVSGSYSSDFNSFVTGWPMCTLPGTLLMCMDLSFMLTTHRIQIHLLIILVCTRHCVSLWDGIIQKSLITLRDTNHYLLTLSEQVGRTLLCGRQLLSSAILQLGGRKMVAWRV